MGFIDVTSTWINAVNCILINIIKFKFSDKFFQENAFQVAMAATWFKHPCVERRKPTE